jgi:hypothetical protein
MRALADPRAYTGNGKICYYKGLQLFRWLVLLMTGENDGVVMPNAECRMPNAERIHHMEDRRTGGEPGISIIIIKRSSHFMRSRNLKYQPFPPVLRFSM